ncbi:membrane protein insertase YidC [Sphingomicrobium lutaoense]|uniref:Membrane protein insertase YidC n=1 Tax=Sphingomicrobium lutaoense TaxID=515949 RepID=A0A839Z1H8_9SPHN|nr:membrane protein insertase YidC [Sphingomicrobium lutaoense]MBB3763907.1 YidC/Oxa1 family membrane protein insertase [Sphingomicrobium lutaoense]
MQDNRNLILAIVLSAIVLIGWSIFFPTSTEELPAEQPPQEQIADAPGGTDAPVAAQPRTVDQALAEGGRVPIDTPLLKGSINLQGARIDDLSLVRHRYDQKKNSEAIRLLSPAGTPKAYFAEAGWTGEGVETPGPSTVWQASADRLTPEKPLTLTWENGTGQRFIQTISVDDGYLFTIERRVENRGEGAIAVRPYATARRAQATSDQSFWTVHLGPMGVFNDAAEYDIDYETLDEEGRQRFTTTDGWVGFTDKYWLTAIIPGKGESVTANMRAVPSGGYQVDYVSEPMLIAPGQAKSGTTRLFAGAKEKEFLDRYEDEGVVRISKAIDWGWFEWFMRPIFDLLRWLFHVTGNFGVAIICLTFLVRLVLYPIANKQFRSMAGMRRIQPKLKALQDRYKEDKPRLQQEMLKLYKEEKINPAAGCLPILLQIPIFYALYKVLLVSVEMRHQPFVLWLQDLSAPDPLTPVNLFGLLDFTPPSWIAIGILPILLGITMWLQFKLNPQPMTDPVQKQVFGIMPWVLMVIMAPFAAGLQLYWVVSNILTIAQQKWLYYRYDKEQEASEHAAQKG